MRTLPLSLRGYLRLKEDVKRYGFNHPGVKYTHGDPWERIEATIWAGGFVPDGLDGEDLDRWLANKQSKA